MLFLLQVSWQAYFLSWRDFLEGFIRYTLLILKTKILFYNVKGIFIEFSRRKTYIYSKKTYVIQDGNAFRAPEIIMNLQYKSFHTWLIFEVPTKRFIESTGCIYNERNLDVLTTEYVVGLACRQVLRENVVGAQKDGVYGEKVLFIT